jgi:CheY-like chemotaxis protein
MVDAAVGRRRVLVVEDDKGIRAVLADWLAAGYDAVFATCQAECLEQLRAPDFDLVLLDLQLPLRSGDMSPGKQVGLEILREIRKRGLTQRGSATLLPVIVMTAHGSETLTAQVLVEYKANDYIPKPFASADLTHKIENALGGEGALWSQRGDAGAKIRIAFHPKESIVQIESLTYDGPHFGLLRVLGDLYVKDLQLLQSVENFRGILGDDLAKKLELGGKAARQRVVRFRTQVRKDFREKLGRVIGKNDVIENVRRWDGYRLNPRIVRVLAWGQIADIPKR